MAYVSTVYRYRPDHTGPRGCDCDRIVAKMVEAIKNAFKSGCREDAENLLLSYPQNSVVYTKFRFIDRHIERVSLLHLAAYHGWSCIVDKLVLLPVYHDVRAVKFKDGDGNTPLHYAAYNGHLQVIDSLINCRQLRDPEEKNRDGSTPLHLSCIKGHLDVAKYLIDEAPSPCSSSCENNNGSMPLHIACSNGHLRIIKYLVGVKKCDPSCANKYGSTPLHLACHFGHFDIVQYLITEAKCNPSSEDDDGNTVLHIACVRNHTPIVQYLLSVHLLNSWAENKIGRTPLSYASGNYNIVRLFQTSKSDHEHYKNTYPVHTFIKLFLIGDSRAGKTTMASFFHKTKSPNDIDSCVSQSGVTDLERFTAGIVPLKIESNLGNFVVYDFAGQQAYYSSHAAILEHVMCRSAALFLCIVDLSKNNEGICCSLKYWLNFINNACTSEEKSHVVVIGSHADLVQSPEEMEEKILCLKTVLSKKRVKNQVYDGCVTLDCRQADDTSQELLSILKTTHKAITANQPAINFYCHVLYAFLLTKINEVGCTLQDLSSYIVSENNPSLPTDLSVLSELLMTLSDKGLILFLKNNQSSWIVVKTEVLLQEINGTVFAPRHFREYHELASNTGLVPACNIQELFPHLNLEMLLGFLEALQFCRPVDHSVLEYTNLINTEPSPSTREYIFFPGLIQSERPDNIIQQERLEFGWCICCLDDHQFLSSRFLHVLLLIVAYKYPLASRYNPSRSLSGLQRKCTVWRNGISWRNDDNITTVVELIDNNRRVLLAMSYDKPCAEQFAKLRSSLIALIIGLRQEHCASVEVSDYLVSPSLVQQYPFDTLPDTDLFDIHDVGRSILQSKPVVLSYKDGRGSLNTSSIPYEPYQFLAKSYVFQLLNSKIADEPVPSSLLHCIRHVFHQFKMKPQNYKQLRECLDGMSIFAGRNPLVSAC